MSRESEVQERRKEIEPLRGRFWSLEAISIPAAGLFAEALLAYEIGAFGGTVLLCRGAVEAACYGFLTRSRNDQPRGAWIVHPQSKLDGSARRIDFEEMRIAIKKRGIFTSSQLRNLKRIQENGNIIAHLAPKMDALIGRADPEDSFPWHSISRPEAIRNLRDALDLLSRFSQILVETPEIAGPGPRKTKTIVETKVILERTSRTRRTR